MQMVSMIHLYLMDDVVIHVLGETSLMVMWTKLEEIYMAKSLTNTVIHVLGETFPMVMWMKLEEMYMMKSLTFSFIGSSSTSYE